MYFQRKNSTARKLKQVPAGYLIVGINPHKKKHAAVAMTQDAVVHTKLGRSPRRDQIEIFKGRSFGVTISFT
ncbi:hypothetical protein HKBW3S03_00295 [Candidatus Hakubella thermalkaliphila]|uniref:Uncharacterized protein n=2 Tax=Candidatus Hakubella thermalkaliphila TaxID=2754717 RepID=A0A6V8PTD4_9ACTN|nr:hypothetical protein [Candidatus Hakubella thermalkaliphila]GFP18790.1 hypothetical protein HKBW3S03_00295 [Candidatus Hakubella thermalkaliphila]GFP27943.1 hypothetical protein HKBW3S33_01354 [Candidatus Hakubella thermalkaliphila]GFP30552.1 hypothetical protein HKBW3S34_01472 [Candidatus Hakubella thermalkaliphila]GFP34266.1 hypothetical protein HKBW3S43_00057 [Candidatus Hakubella thermalkaliphila]GFP37139.1 hypothetical protein HKBW3S44_00819 [Candidatus Hakubella thermalkaliphila]